MQSKKKCSKKSKQKKTKPERTTAQKNKPDLICKLNFNQYKMIKNNNDNNKTIEK